MCQNFFQSLLKFFIRKWRLVFNISNYFLNVVIVEKSADTRVTAGDNKGMTLRNDHPSLMFQAENLKGLNTLTRIPMKKVKKAPGREMILFLQDKQTRAVVAATSVGFD
mgnify:CR=1 FL=1